MKINIIFGKGSIKVSNDQRELLCDVITSNSNSFEENSPMLLFLQQQKEQVLKSPKAIRWHPLIIRCLSIYQTSPAAYMHIARRQNKFIALPHINTLKKYIDFTDPMSSFNPNILDQILEDINFDGLKKHVKNVSIVFDEMKIQEGNLVYKKSTGKRIGYTEMGDLNEKISEFSVWCYSPEADTFNISKRIATYVNVFMVKGICSRLCTTFGHRASTGFTADQLFPLVWEATRILECVGFKMRA